MNTRSGNLGIYSMWPNEWGKTQEEVDAMREADRLQDIADAKAAAEVKYIDAQAAAAASQMDPSLWDFGKKAAGSGLDTLTTGYRIALWGGGGLLLYFFFKEFVQPAGTERSLARQAYRDVSASKKDLLRIAAKL